MNPVEILDNQFNSKKIQKIPLKIKSRFTNDYKLAFLLENILTPEECQSLIDLSEKKGYEPALINIGDGQGVYDPDYRKSSRVLIDDIEFAEKMWSRIKGFIPQDFVDRKERTPIGFNERLRFLKYNPGDFFGKHADGCYERPDRSARTFITVQLYLNGPDGMKGGETTFLEDIKNPLGIQPKTGLALVFEHNIVHEGSKLIDGVKYTIRMDILFKRNECLSELEKISSRSVCEPNEKRDTDSFFSNLTSYFKK